MIDSLYKVKFFFKDKPVPFITEKSKKDKLVDYDFLISPITMENYDEYRMAKFCLDMDYNKYVVDYPFEKYVEILQLKYIDFISFLLETKHSISEMLVYSLFTIFKLCLGIESTNIQIKSIDGEMFFVIDDNIFIGSEDFLSLAEIILNQNDPYYKDERNIDINIKKDLEEHRSITSQRYEPVDFEKLVACFCALKHCKFSDVLEMTVRRFILEDDVLNSVINYTINTLSESTGNVKFKNPIEHYLYKIKKSGIEGFVDYDTMESKIKGTP